VPVEDEDNELKDIPEKLELAEELV